MKKLCYMLRSKRGAVAQKMAPDLAYLTLQTSMPFVNVLLFFIQSQDYPFDDKSTKEHLEEACDAGTAQQNNESEESQNISESHIEAEACAGETAEPTDEPNIVTKR